MQRIPLVRRKSLLNAGLTNSQVMNLTQRNPYFKKREGDQSIFTPFDAFLLFVASELFNFLPFRNVNQVVNELVEKHRNLYGLVRQNPKQFLAVELRSIDFVPEIPLEEYIVFPLLAETLKVLDWENRRSIVLINLEKIHRRVEDLFEKEGIQVSDGSID